MGALEEADEEVVADLVRVGEAGACGGRRVVRGTVGEGVWRLMVCD